MKESFITKNIQMNTGMFEIKQHLLILAHFHSKCRPIRTNFPSKADSELLGKTKFLDTHSTLKRPKLDTFQVDSG